MCRWRATKACGVTKPHSFATNPYATGFVQNGKPPQPCDSQERSLWATRSPRNGSSLQNHSGTPAFWPQRSMICPLRTGLSPSPSAGGSARKPHAVAGFGCKVFKYLLGLRETLQDRPGSNLLTTRRFTHKWQDDIPGVTELLGGGWSSVSQRRSTPLARSHCFGRRAELHQGGPQIEPHPICAQQTNY